jgi:hypothetical protein
MTTKSKNSATAVATVKNASKTVIAENTKTAQQIIKQAEAKRKEELAAKNSEKGKAKNSGKTEDKKVKSPKVDKLPAMAKVQDIAILKGGTWKHIIDSLLDEAKKRNYKIVLNESYLRGHIKFRLNTNKAYLGDLVVTETGVFKAEKKSKKGAA